VVSGLSKFKARTKKHIDEVLFKKPGGLKERKVL
jgi:hypothetical protein